MMGRDGFLKMRSMILGHDPMGGNMFRGVGHGGHRLYHGNPAGTRGNKLYRMMMREQEYQRRLQSIGIDLKGVNIYD